MKYVFTILIFLISISPTHITAQTSRDYGLMVNVLSNYDPPKVTLKWQQVEFVEKYVIKKKNQLDQFRIIAEITSLDTVYEDTDVERGQVYEYMVEARCSAMQSYQGNNYPHEYGSTGYAMASVAMPEVTSYGKVILCIDSTIAEPLAMEIDRLVDDLLKDGWGVIKLLVPRREEFDGEAVKQVKQIIMDEYHKDVENINTVFLLGRVPVPYSGLIAPDGHTRPPIHTGAWPADAYYGCTNDNYWTDEIIQSDTAAREANNNIIGDGKFDQSEIDNVKLAVGRVDMYNMPAFEKSEIELLRQYLDKDHAYRIGELEYQMRGLVDEASSFTPQNRGHSEAFASAGWRNIGTLLGIENVYELDWFTTLENDSYMWAYGTGPGGYTSAKQIGNTSDFATKGTKSVFTMLFGSYFGDWDHSNSFLRAPLASEPSALTCSWVARPHWYFHHMGIGYPIGYSTVLSQNNQNEYTFKYFYVFLGQSYPGGAVNPSGNRMIHVALMGDPTLRMNMTNIIPPKNLSAMQTGKYEVTLTWVAPPTDDIKHFNVYRSFNEFGPFEKINDEPVLSSEFIDEDIQHDGSVYYMVRTVKMFHSYSGMYYNQSRGDIAEIIASDIDEYSGDFYLKANPNPATSFLNINLSLHRGSQSKLSVFDINGNEIAILADGWLEPGSHQQSWDLKNKNGDNLPTGIYMIKFQAGNKILIEKISIIK